MTIEDFINKEIELENKVNNNCCADDRLLYESELETIKHRKFSECSLADIIIGNVYKNKIKKK